MSKVSAKARREMEEQMHALDDAAAAVQALLQRTEPFREAAKTAADLPLADWTPDHWALLVFTATKHDPLLSKQIEQFSKAYPAGFIATVAALVRLGYNAAEAAAAERLVLA
jgi:16S rRNA G1207 methylase RsmC